MATMAGDPGAARRPSAWELRERLKHSRHEVARLPRHSTSSIRTASLTDIDEGPIDPGLPPASRHLACGASQKIRRSSGGQKVRNRKDRTSLLSQADTKEKEKEKSEWRKSHIFHSMEKFELDHSTSSTSGLKHYPAKNSGSIMHDPYADDRSLSSLGASSISMGSDPLVKDYHKMAPGAKSSSSFSLSMDLSYHRRSKGQEITMSASDEQWARFKLLGRIGLGDIQVSRAARALIDRNVSLLRRALKNIVALRDGVEAAGDHPENADTTLDIRTGYLLEEVRATIEIPKEAAKFRRDPDTIELGLEVEDQLQDYVRVISSMYRDNAFHNFEHASHVLQSANKLVSLVVTPDDTDIGVTTDPWTHFALVFSALIHDVDHTGVPNAQLIKEGSHVAGAYKNRSVAEQNSIELAWNLLMEPCYRELRENIFSTSSELSRFRGLVVTAVMATDIADKELAALRKGRAAEALSAEDEDPTADLVSRKATFVMETLIQAADVSHTMQPFSVYKKWNHRLYREMYRAYKTGRAEKDPTDSWYRGDLDFFDFYIIPLAKKLSACGVSDQASADYLNNGMSNRKEWESHGEEIVASYVAAIKFAENSKRIKPLATQSSSASSNCSSSEESLLVSDFSDFSNDSDNESECDSYANGEKKHGDPKSLRRQDIPTLRKKLSILKKEKQELSDRKLSVHRKLPKVGQNASAKPENSKSRQPISSLKAKKSKTDGIDKAGDQRRKARRVVYKDKGRSSEKKKVEATDEKKRGVRRARSGDLAILPGATSLKETKLVIADQKARLRSKSLDT
jgi:hypothetical protein